MSRIAKLLRAHEERLHNDWLKEQTSRGFRHELIRDTELRVQSQELLRLLADALESGAADANADGPAYAHVREMLAGLSRSRGLQGFSPSETGHFVLSLKRPLLNIIGQEPGIDKGAIFDETMRVNLLVDQLGIFTTEVYQKSREEIIRRQQSEMLELSTPVVKLWDGILAMPFIGTLDSQRTSVVMETLLQRIVETNSEVAIIDITGVPTVDTLVAQHLIKTVAAARLMGAECIVYDARTHSHLEDGQVPPGLDPGRHERSAGARATGRPDGAHLGDRRVRRARRHLGAADGRLVHRPHHRQHRRHGQRHGRTDGAHRHAAGRHHHRRRAGRAAHRRAHRARHRPRHEAARDPDGAAPPTQGRRHQVTSAQPRSGATMNVVKRDTVPIRTESDVVRARQTVRAWSQEVGFTLVDTTKLVTAASELARNTYDHGGGGEMTLEVHQDGERRGLRLIFVDQGPGIADVDLAMRDGYTTGKGMGMGLGGSRRLVNEFEIESRPQQGTRVAVTRWRT
jgi:rsbT co-antagonist protein RsbR